MGGHAWLRAIYSRMSPRTFPFQSPPRRTPDQRPRWGEIINFLTRTRQIQIQLLYVDDRMRSTKVVDTPRYRPRPLDQTRSKKECYPWSVLENDPPQPRPAGDAPPTSASCPSGVNHTFPPASLANGNHLLGKAFHVLLRFPPAKLVRASVGYGVSLHQLRDELPMPVASWRVSFFFVLVKKGCVCVLCVMSSCLVVNLGHGRNS